MYSCLSSRSGCADVIDERMLRLRLGAGIMDGHNVDNHPGCDSERERRIERLIARLPARLQPVVRWLRRPVARWVRIPAGLLLVAGSLLALLPVFGLWMLPLGLLLLADDLPPVRRFTGRILCWIEVHRPHWMGLSPASSHD